MANVLTDTELVNAFDRAAAAGGLGPFGLRAVERAVVAKIAEKRCCCLLESRGDKDVAAIRHNAYLARLRQGKVTEADARKRERAAWDAGTVFACKGTYHAERDRRYPLPKRDRAIPLSSGELVTVERDIDFPPSRNAYVRLNATSVLTAADIASLAELVKSPTEPCE